MAFFHNPEQRLWQRITGRKTQAPRGPAAWNSPLSISVSVSASVSVSVFVSVSIAVSVPVSWARRMELTSFYLCLRLTSSSSLSLFLFLGTHLLRSLSLSHLLCFLLLCLLDGRSISSFTLLLFRCSNCSRATTLLPRHFIAPAPVHCISSINISFSRLLHQFYCFFPAGFCRLMQSASTSPGRVRCKSTMGQNRKKNTE